MNLSHVHTWELNRSIKIVRAVRFLQEEEISLYVQWVIRKKGKIPLRMGKDKRSGKCSNATALFIVSSIKGGNS